MAGGTIDLSPALQKGLYPLRNPAKNEQAMAVYQNSIPTELGARPMITPTYPEGLAALSASWPFPHFLRLEDTLLRCEEDTLFEVTEQDGDWSEAELDVYALPTYSPLLKNQTFQSSTYWTMGTNWALRETITNGTFTGSAAGWTLNSSGAGWTYAANAIVHAGPAWGVAAQYLADQVSGNGLVPGVDYYVTFTVSGRTAGSVSAYVGTEGAGTSRSTNATFTEIITCSGDPIFLFLSSDTFDGVIDTVSVTQVGQMVHTGGSASYLKMLAASLTNPVVQDRVYKVIIDTEDWTGAGLSVNIGGGTPVPVLAQGRQVLYVTAGAGTDFEVYGPNAMTVTIKSIYCSEYIAETTIAAGGWQWRGAGFGPWWIITNGASLVFKLPGNFGEKILIASTTVNAQSAVNWGNQLALGGVAGTWLATTSFTGLLDYWKQTQAASGLVDVVISDLDDQDLSWIFISSRGGGDVAIPFWLFLAMFGLPNLAAFELAEGLIRTSVAEGAFQIIPLRGIGDILQLLPLGDDLVVYGSKATAVLRRTEGGAVQQSVLDLGVSNGTSACGSLSKHFVRTTDDLLYEWPAGGGPKQLRYEPHMAELTAANVAAAFDPVEGYAWFGDGYVGFTRTRTGLSKTSNVIPTGVVRSRYVPDNVVGAYVEPAVAGDTVWRTVWFDAGESGMFELTRIAVQWEDDGPDDCTALVYYRFESNESPRQSNSFDIDLRGLVQCKVPGKEWQVEIRVSVAHASNGNLERLTVSVTPVQAGKLALRDIVDV